MRPLTAERLEAIKCVNDESLNQSAEAILPDDWKGGSSISVLALALWGLNEAGLHYHPLSPDSPDDQAIEDAILRLMDLDPMQALCWMKGYESCDDDGMNATGMADEALDGCDSPEDAAWIVITEIALGLNEDRPLPRLSGFNRVK